MFTWSFTVSRQNLRFIKRILIKVQNKWFKIECSGLTPLVNLKFYRKILGLTVVWAFIATNIFVLNNESTSNISGTVQHNIHTFFFLSVMKKIFLRNLLRIILYHYPKQNIAELLFYWKLINMTWKMTPLPFSKYLKSILRPYIFHGK